MLSFPSPLRRRLAMPFLALLLLAPAGAPAYASCTPSGGAWDTTCLRALYARDIGEWPRPQGMDRADWREMAPLSRLEPPTPQPARSALGERLFFDPRLSRSGLLACVSCHRPSHGFADTQATSSGHDGRLGKRNAPTVLGAAYATSLFWDGRAASLEEQALGPLAHPDEMAMPLAALPPKLAALDGYETAFAQAFAAERADDGGGSAVTLARIASALADYQRTLLPPETRFDRFLSGERDAFDDRELLGLHLFRTKARCMTCHDGPLLSDNRFHNLGLTWYGRQYEDLGRYEATGQHADVGRFRTPTLRQVAHTGPWMHNGRFPMLSGILNMYNAGMPRPRPANEEQRRDPLFPVTSELLQPLQLTPAELEALEAFLRTL